MASGTIAPDEWRRLARRKLTLLDQRIADAQSAREAIAHSLRCPHESFQHCPNFAAVVTARLAGKTRSEARRH